MLYSWREKSIMVAINAGTFIAMQPRCVGSASDDVSLWNGFFILHHIIVTRGIKKDIRVFTKTRSTQNLRSLALALLSLQINIEVRLRFHAADTDPRSQIPDPRLQSIQIFFCIQCGHATKSCRRNCLTINMISHIAGCKNTGNTG